MRYEYWETFDTNIGYGALAQAWVETSLGKRPEPEGGPISLSFGSGRRPARDQPLQWVKKVHIFQRMISPFDRSRVG
ncbi:MAG: hypothetical protein DSZ24_04650 [Thermodesulfatator sp.]|nr:MAG: hypothetical protein DSZ24_04650 [Thermodesulfatator sp.]